MEERIVIVAYRPKEGKVKELQQLMKEHVSIPREQNLATDRAPKIMVAKDGTINEVFEWKSEEAMEAAHHDPVVLKMWERFAIPCEYIPVGRVEEFAKLFSQFTPF